jgi:predicted XRE-type DNA-binding protein
MEKDIKREKKTKLEKLDDSDIVIDGSGDIFDDIGLTLSPIDRLKVDLAYAISEVIRLRGMTQVQAAFVIGISQARVSDIVRGNLGRFKVEKLFDFLLRLGVDLDVKANTLRIKPERELGVINFQQCSGERAYG